jgi:HK97 family phage major capsid protein
MPETTQLEQASAELSKKLSEMADKGNATESQLKELKTSLEGVQKEIQNIKAFNNAYNVSGIESSHSKFAAALGGILARSMASQMHGKKALAAVSKSELDSVKGYSGEFKEMGEAIFEKAATFSIDSDGGLLVPTQLMVSEFVDNFRPDPETIFDLGARLIDLTPGTGIIVIPRKTGNSTTYTLSENGTPTLSKVSMETVELSPKRIAVLTSISNTLLFSQQAVLDIWQKDMLRELNISRQMFVLYGTGSNGQPLGLYSTPGINTVALNTITSDTNGRAMSYTDVGFLEDALLSVDAPIGPNSAALFIPKLLKQMKQERVAQYSGASGNAGTLPILANNAALASISRDSIVKAIGYKIATLTNLVKTRTVGTSTDGTDVFFGNWEQARVYNWGTRVKTSDLAYAGGVSAFTDNVTHVQMESQFDTFFTNPANFVVGSGIRSSL